MFRRKQIPDQLMPVFRAFSAQVEQLEAARNALMSCLPVGRVEPAPVQVGLDLLDETIALVAAELSEWRHPDLETEWQGCRAALAESADAIPTAHRIADSTGELEELLGAVADVDEPLGHAFRQAERAFRRLRR